MLTEPSFVLDAGEYHKFRNITTIFRSHRTNIRRSLVSLMILAVSIFDPSNKIVYTHNTNEKEHELVSRLARE
jgi:hypothetical protein